MQRAFSLVELSIVLVILGLLAGGILAGQSLIRAAELRSVVGDYQRYAAAVGSFRDKYLSIPGDMTNATSFWGSMTNCAAASPSGSGTQTCNGNGSGFLNAASSASQTGETFGFWKHLANAGLVEGNYTGIAGTYSGADGDIGINTPASRLATAGWMVTYRNMTGNGNFYDGNFGNTFQFGTDIGAGTLFGAALKPEETWNIDTKLDDGKPGRGNMLAIQYAGCAGAASSTDYDTNYALATKSIECAFLIKNAF